MSDHLRDSLQKALGDGYRMERELGGGGMSRVFVARDLALDRDVVVKVLSTESTAGVSGDRFRREIQVIARLQHPHVVPILAAGSAEGALYYVMPFMGGETLRARITREGPLGVADAVRVLREVLDALSFAHKHGVIHRDIKPENVLLEAGHAVVADFGIAKALRESGTMTSAGISLGTPAYMAPEQATADPTTDHRADLYAVGAVAYELLTGAPPFTGNVQQMITSHLTTPPPPLRDKRSDVPVAVADVIMRALAKDPAERPQSAGEMIAALEVAITPVALTPASLPAAATRRSHTRLIAAAVAVLVLAVAGIVALRGRAPKPTVADGAELIAVMPLAAVSDSSLARLGQDLVVTLSTNLDGVGSLRTIDAVTLLMRARKLPQPIPLADAQALARELGARSVLTGTLITEGDRVRASVVLHQVGSDSALAKATAIAAPTEIAALTDSLTWEVLRQVWRRGTAPSPVLSGLTTKSFDALRAFLDGERHFQGLDIEKALVSYRRAFEADSNFAQALLRYDYVLSWSLQPVDSIVRRRLLSLVDRLPERERMWVQTREMPGFVPAHFAAWKKLAEAYPDYPPALMSAADIVIHSGPLYGIPMSEARPLLDRLAALAPEHADTRMHQVFEAGADGRMQDALTARDAVAKYAGDGTWGTQFAWEAEVFRAQVAGKSLPPVERADEVARRWTREATSNPAALAFIGTVGNTDIAPSYRMAVLDHLRKAGILHGTVDLAASYGEGLVRTSRGDWAGGLRALQRAESADLGATARIGAARLAAIGAWMGAVDPAVADTTLRRVRQYAGVEKGTGDRAELRWMDGLIGVAQGDEPRVRRAVRELDSDTATLSRRAGRSLTGLWAARSNADAGADSLRAISDESMIGGGFLLPVESVNRLVIARALRRRGKPANAERYLMWTDAAVNVARTFSTVVPLMPLVAYERGLAAEETGNKAAATLHLRRFVDGYDQPPNAHKAMVADAKKRLARLTGADVPR